MVVKLPSGRGSLGVSCAVQGEYLVLQGLLRKKRLLARGVAMCRPAYSLAGESLRRGTSDTSSLSTGDRVQGALRYYR